MPKTRHLRPEADKRSSDRHIGGGSQAEQRLPHEAAILSQAFYIIQHRQ